MLRKSISEMVILKRYRVLCRQITYEHITIYFTVGILNTVFKVGCTQSKTRMERTPVQGGKSRKDVLYSLHTMMLQSNINQAL
jgi:hypothetical protein